MKHVSILIAGIFAPSIGFADLFVSSFNENSVRRYSDAGVFQSNFIPANDNGLSLPHRGIFLGDGDFYLASAGNDRIMRYDGDTGAYLSDFIAGNALLDYPVDLKLGPDGDLFISSQLNHSILRYDFGSSTLSTFVSSGSGGLSQPSGIDFGPDGNLYVSGRASGSVHIYDGDTGAPISGGIFATSTGDNFGLEWGADGVLYLANASGEIRRFNSSGTPLGAYNSGGLSFPVGLEFGPHGALYAADYADDELRRFSSAGTAGTSFLSGAAIDGPNFMTFHIPEPGSAALLLASAGWLFVHRTRRSPL